MPIPVTCSSCGTKLKAPDNAAGRKLKCPKCSTPILVGGGESAAPAAAAGTKSNKTEPAVKAAPAGKTAVKPAPAAKASPAKEETAANDSWASSPLLSEQQWMIRTKEKFFFSNFSAPRYDITRMGEKEILGRAVGRPGFFTKLLWGMNRRLRQFLAYKFEIHEGEEEQLLCSIRFPTPILNFRPRAEVYDPDGNLLGSFTRKLFAFTVNYELRNPEEEKIGTFSFRMGDFRAGKCPPRVALALDEGAEWGFVTGETHMEVMDLVKEGKAKAKVKIQFMAPPPALVIQIDPKAADRPETKALLLAGAVILKAYGYDKMFKV